MEELLEAWCQPVPARELLTFGPELYDIYDIRDVRDIRYLRFPRSGETDHWVPF